MDSQYIYREVKKILSEEPELKKEFDELRTSLEKLPDGFSKVGFAMQFQEYEEFIEILISLANLPKIKFRT